MTQAALQSRGRAWRDLGLGDEASPGKLAALLALDLEGCMWDPQEHRVLIDPSLLTAEDFVAKTSDDAASSLLLGAGVRPDEPVVAHVLVHALETGTNAHPGCHATTDELLAARAWEEGKANLVAILFLFQGLGLGSQVVSQGLDPGEVLDGRLVPTRVRSSPGAVGHLSSFVFEEGFAQAAAQLKAGGWSLVDKSAASRRRTRDLIHTDRAARQPAPVEPPAGPAGFRLADHDSLGEAGIVALVSLLTGKDNLGLLAGDGWVSDDLFRWEATDPGQPPGGARTLRISRWDSPQEAVDFQYGLVRTLQARFPEALAAATTDSPMQVTAGGQVFQLERVGSEVRLTVSPEQRRPTPKAGSPASSTRKTQNSRKY
jgi:hypothetical protein